MFSWAVLSVCLGATQGGVAIIVVNTGTGVSTVQPCAFVKLEK